MILSNYFKKVDLLYSEVKPVYCIFYDYQQKKKKAQFNHIQGLTIDWYSNVIRLLPREVLVNKGHVELYFVWKSDSVSLATAKFS